MNDNNLTTITIDQLQQALNGVFPVAQQQQQQQQQPSQQTSCVTLATSNGTSASLQHGLTVASLPQIPINIGQVSSLPLLNVVPVTDSNITNKQALTIPLSRLIQAKDVSGTTQVMTVQNQSTIVNPGHGQNNVMGTNSPSLLQTADLPVINATVLQQTLQQAGNIGSTNINQGAMATSVLDTSATYAVMTSVQLQVQPTHQGQTSVYVLPSAAASSSNQVIPITCTTSTASAPIISCGPIASVNAGNDAMVQGMSLNQTQMKVEEIVIQNPGQDKENHSAAPAIGQDHQSQHGIPNSMSVLEYILKSSDGAPELMQHGKNKPDVHVTTTQKSGIRLEGFYCVDCDANYIDACPNHGKDYRIVNDTPMLSKARMSVPNKLFLKPSGIQAATTGVFTRQALERRIRFGPLEGVVNDKVDSVEFNNSVKTWKIFENGKCTKILDGRDENHANWMMFVQFARNNKEQNLIAYQQNHQIFFATSKDIEPNTELLLWFAKDYATLIDVPPKADDMFKCKICHKQFPGNTELKQHTKYSHPDMSNRKWKCQWCTRAFQSSSKLQTHLLSHMGVKPHKCQFCNKPFTDSSNLRVHLRLHTGEKKFRCEVCDRLFTQKSHLESHMVSHTKEKKYSCQYCDAQFGRMSDLKAHGYKHSKEKVLTCFECNKSFYTAYSYKRHLKIHTGQKDHPCQYCGKLFITKYHAVRHMTNCKGPKIKIKSEA